MSVIAPTPRLVLAPERVLVVADWSLDPHAVVARLVREANERAITWSLLVPAWLHGLDWAGDPYANLPRAEVALLTIRELAVAAGLDVDLAVVGDHEPVTAVGDASREIASDRILLCTRRRRFSRSHPLDLAHRMGAVSGVPVAQAALASAGRR